ncbi:MAG: 5'/3'-nucleotidase SurE, partial [Erysipelotrichaceae bacterium]|nr:5'/3'-nucleotidase SurE [Erysipelotrichaceae bacterium]
MNILITNDDGIDFKGLRQLVKTFSELGNVYVVAPNDERSSNSHHLTVKGRVRYEERD